jgi:nitrate reductase NapA
MHPEDAIKYGVKQGELAWVESRRGKVAKEKGGS